MLAGVGYPSGTNYPAGAGMEIFSYPCAGTGNPTDKIYPLRVRVWVAITRRVCTRCHLDFDGWSVGTAGGFEIFFLYNSR